MKRIEEVTKDMTKAERTEGGPFGAPARVGFIPREGRALQHISYISYIMSHIYHMSHISDMLYIGLAINSNLNRFYSNFRSRSVKSNLERRYPVPSLSSPILCPVPSSPVPCSSTSLSSPVKIGRSVGRTCSGGPVGRSVGLARSAGRSDPTP